MHSLLLSSVLFLSHIFAELLAKIYKKNESLSLTGALHAKRYSFSNCNRSVGGSFPIRDRTLISHMLNACVAKILSHDNRICASATNFTLSIGMSDGTEISVSGDDCWDTMEYIKHEMTVCNATHSAFPTNEVLDGVLLRFKKFRQDINNALQQLTLDDEQRSTLFTAVDAYLQGREAFYPYLEEFCTFLSAQKPRLPTNYFPLSEQATLVTAPYEKLVNLVKVLYQKSSTIKSDFNDSDFFNIIMNDGICWAKVTDNSYKLIDEQDLSCLFPHSSVRKLVAPYNPSALDRILVLYDNLIAYLNEKLVTTTYSSQTKQRFDAQAQLSRSVDKLTFLTRDHDVTYRFKPTPRVSELATENELAPAPLYLYDGRMVRDNYSDRIYDVNRLSEILVLEISSIFLENHELTATIEHGLDDTFNIGFIGFVGKKDIKSLFKTLLRDLRCMNFNVDSPYTEKRPLILNFFVYLNEFLGVKHSSEKYSDKLHEYKLNLKEELRLYKSELGIENVSIDVKPLPTVYRRKIDSRTHKLHKNSFKQFQSIEEIDSLDRIFILDVAAMFELKSKALSDTGVGTELPRNETPIYKSRFALMSLSPAFDNDRGILRQFNTELFEKMRSYANKRANEALLINKKKGFALYVFASSVNDLHPNFPEYSPNIAIREELTHARKTTMARVPSRLDSGCMATTSDQTDGYIYFPLFSIFTAICPDEEFMKYVIAPLGIPSVIKSFPNIPKYFNEEVFLKHTYLRINYKGIGKKDIAKLTYRFVCAQNDSLETTNWVRRFLNVDEIISKLKLFVEEFLTSAITTASSYDDINKDGKLLELLVRRYAISVSSAGFAHLLSQGKLRHKQIVIKAETDDICMELISSKNDLFGNLSTTSLVLRLLSSAMFEAHEQNRTIDFIASRTNNTVDNYREFMDNIRVTMQQLDYDVTSNEYRNYLKII